MVYHNGLEMPPRPKGMMVTNFGKYYITEVRNYEKRIMDAIDSGKVYDVSIRPAAPSSLHNTTVPYRARWLVVSGG
jgi:hypothetical protein